MIYSAGANQENSEDFLQFKMRQNQRKVTPNKEPTIVVSNGHSVDNFTKNEQNSAEWEDMEFEPMVRGNERFSNNKKNSKRAFEIGASRPTPGSIGKLKLSSEMRQRLELVTANHSVRSTSSRVDKPARVVNKLEDTRKMMLEQQLAGIWDVSQNNSGKSSPDMLNHVSIIIFFFLVPQMSLILPLYLRGLSSRFSTCERNSLVNPQHNHKPPAVLPLFNVYNYYGMPFFLRS